MTANRAVLAALLLAAPANAEKPAPKTVDVRIKDKRPRADSKIVNDGDTLRICNLDQIFHAPFSYSAHNRFETPGKGMAPGACTTAVAKNPTNTAIPLVIFCALHSYEKLALAVAPGGDVDESQPEELWKKAPGRWSTGKAVLDMVDTGNGFEGHVVEPAANWPKSVKPPRIFFKSTVVGGDTIHGLILQLPQGEECPGLAAAQFDKARLTVDPSGDRITVVTTTRYYDAKKCEWAKKTAQDTVTWNRVK